MRLLFLLPLLFICKSLLAQNSDRTIEKPTEEERFEIVDNPATPKGGYPALYKHFSENFHYPDSARILGIEGTVYVQFVVNKDGSLSDVLVLRGIGAGCDKVAVSMVKSSSWNPPTQKGVAVRQRIVLPVKFELEKKEKKRRRKN